MFRRLPVLLSDKRFLRELADGMVEKDGRDPAGDNDAIPAGYTYLGQLLTTTSRSTPPLTSSGTTIPMPS